MRKNHGVLFLDEFNHLSKAIQSKLLVALQTDAEGNFSVLYFLPQSVKII